MSQGGNPYSSRFEKKNKESKLISFEKKCYIEKRDIMLTWFLDGEVIEKIKIYNYIVEESSIESRPEKILDIFNDMVDLNLIRFFFSQDGWNMLRSVIEIKKETNVVCPACSANIGA